MISFPDEIEFDILKTPSVLHRVIVFMVAFALIGFCLYATSTFALYFGIENRLVIGVLLLPSMTIIYFLERKYDKKIRSQITGKIILNKNEISVFGKINEKFYFSDILMFWINFGMQTLDDGKQEGYLFRSFETIKIRIIDQDSNIHYFHVNNDANIDGSLIVSEFIDYLKKYHQFFKIHFHEQKRFDKSEYQKTLKRFTLMQSSLRRRKKRGK